MRKISTLLAILMLGFATESSAQTTFGGTVLHNDYLGWNDLYNLSFTSHNYGTARSMAMGNAFTALGSDLASASLNPAGIGMYSSNNFNIGFMMQFSKTRTPASDPYYVGVPRRHQEFKDHTERFGMASVGGIANVYNGTGALTSFNFGVVYNRIADFNHDSMSASIGNPAYESMANLFATLGNVDGLVTNNNGTMPFGDDPYYWGAVLAYKNGLTNKDDQGWFVDRISGSAEIDQYSAIQTRGSIGEYAITAGMNFSDIFYIGATLGIQSVNYRRTIFYGENYIYTDGLYPSGADMPYQLEYMNYSQSSHVTGTGINFKIGITLRPVHWMRLGVAYHTPTYYALAHKYSSQMWSCTYSAGNNPDGYDLTPDGYMYDNVYSPELIDDGPNAWKFRSPSRLLLGAAFTIAQRIILSADYERSWYQSIRLTHAPIWGLDYTDATLEVFKGSNTVRVGAEAVVTNFLALRMGYIYSGSTLRPDYTDILASHPMVTEQRFVTAGLGIQCSSNFAIDLAYQYGVTDYTRHQTFFAIDAYDPEYDISPRVMRNTTKRHIAVISLDFRF